MNFENIEKWYGLKVLGDELLNRVLAPYKLHCRYLKRAGVSLSHNEKGDDVLVGIGIFEIPESCYIDDTGHLNSVEFNICYNQIMYSAIAYSVSQNENPFLPDWSLDKFWEKQLPDILIVDFECSFRRPVDAKQFYVEIEFVKSKKVGGINIINTLSRCWDEYDGCCEGKVKLAIVD